MKRSPLKRTKGLRPRSKKMAEFYRNERVPEVVEAVGGGKRPCQIKSPVCTKYVQGIHEILTRARAGGIMAANFDGNKVPCCHACNQYVTQDVEGMRWAKENGFLRSNRYE